MISLISSGSRLDAAKERGDSEAATVKLWYHWVPHGDQNLYIPVGMGTEEEGNIPIFCTG